MSEEQKEYRESMVKYPDPDSMSYDQDIVDSQSNEKKTFRKFKQQWKVESGEDFENAYQMERDGRAWGGGYNKDDDYKHFVRKYAKSLWGDAVDTENDLQKEKPKEAPKKVTKVAPKKASKEAPKKASKETPKKGEKQ